METALNQGVQGHLKHRGSWENSWKTQAESQGVSDLAGYFTGCFPRHQNSAFAHFLFLSTLWSSSSGHRLALCAGSSSSPVLRRSPLGTSDLQGYAFSLASRGQSWKAASGSQAGQVSFPIQVPRAGGVLGKSEGTTESKINLEVSGRAAWTSVLTHSTREQSVLKQCQLLLGFLSQSPR